jgi:hypothetical protein
MPGETRSKCVQVLVVEVEPQLESGSALRGPRHRYFFGRHHW